MVCNAYPLSLVAVILLLTPAKRLVKHKDPGSSGATSTAREVAVALASHFRAPISGFAGSSLRRPRLEVDVQLTVRFILFLYDVHFALVHFKPKRTNYSLNSVGIFCILLPLSHRRDVFHPRAARETVGYEPLDRGMVRQRCCVLSNPRGKTRL